MKGKSWDSTKERVCSQFGGVIIHGWGTRIFAFDDAVGKDGSLWATILLKVIIDEYNRRRREGLPWPSILFLQMDNGPDNKNSAVFGLGELLVRLGIFKVVRFSFLPVGHTHEDIDAFFGALSHLLSAYCAYTVEEIGKIAARAWKNFKRIDILTVRSPLYLFNTSFSPIHKCCTYICMRTQEKLDVKGYFDKHLVNSNLRGIKYPGVVEWTMVPTANGGQQVKMTWKANM